MVLFTPEVGDNSLVLERRRSSCRYYGSEFRIQKATVALELQNLYPEPATSRSNDAVSQHLLTLHAERLERAEKTLAQRMYNLSIEEKMMRMPSQDEAMYRASLLSEFQQKMSEQFVGMERLRFHGADIVASLGIIDEQAIISTEERGLERRSHDVAGKISVTDKDSVGLSLVDYAGFKDVLLPMGCIFILQPKDDMDEQSIASMAMASIPQKESSRILGILTSRESLALIKQRCEDNKWRIPVCEFLSVTEEFLSASTHALVMP